VGIVGKDIWIALCLLFPKKLFSMCHCNGSVYGALLWSRRDPPESMAAVSLPRHKNEGGGEHHEETVLKIHRRSPHKHVGIFNPLSLCLSFSNGAVGSQTSVSNIPLCFFVY
jgi:hypothetical protein